MPPPMNSDDTLLPLRAITVGGFESIDHEQTIELRPLTILAGANNSGKSSMIQPLLSLKQTLEAPYDPGPLMLNGPNVRFTLVEQFLNRSRVGRKEERFGHYSLIPTTTTPVRDGVLEKAEAEQQQKMPGRLSWVGQRALAFG